MIMYSPMYTYIKYRGGFLEYKLQTTGVTLLERIAYTAHYRSGEVDIITNIKLESTSLASFTGLEVSIKA